MNVREIQKFTTKYVLNFNAMAIIIVGQLILKFIVPDWKSEIQLICLSLFIGVISYNVFKAIPTRFDKRLVSAGFFRKQATWAYVVLLFQVMSVLLSLADSNIDGVQRIWYQSLSAVLVGLSLLSLGLTLYKVRHAKLGESSDSVHAAH